MSAVTPGMFDRVRIRHTPETESLGLAGLVGLVHGTTTPTVTGVNVIGQTRDDHAFNVVLDNKPKDLWFAPDLIEFLDHGPGIEASIGNNKFIRREDGEWTTLSTDNPPQNPGPLTRLWRNLFGR